MSFSIVTPSLNQGRFIRETIESIRRQGDVEVEHIIMDGGSTDETVSILREYSGIQWVSQADSGQSDALITGFSKATGQIWSWLNSDDVLADNVLGRVLDHFQTHPDCMVLYGDIDFVDESGRLLSSRTGPELSHAELIRRPDIVRQPSTFWRAEVFKNAGGLDRRLHLVMDYDFFLRASALYPFHHLPMTLSRYRTYPETKTNSMLTRQAFEIFRVYRKNKIMITPDLLRQLALRAMAGSGIARVLRPLRSLVRKSP